MWHMTKGGFTAVCLKTIGAAAQVTSPLFLFWVRFISREGEREGRHRERRQELLKVGMEG